MNNLVNLTGLNYDKKSIKNISPCQYGTDSKVLISAIGSATFLIALAMSLNTTKCIEVQIPGGGSIKNCAQAIGPSPSSSRSPPSTTSPTVIVPSGPHVTTNKSSPPVSQARNSNCSTSCITNITSAADLIGGWKVNGITQGYPLSAFINFRENGTYQISGNIMNLANGSQKFIYSGNYKFNKENKVLLLTSTSGKSSSYYLKNATESSFSASNLGTNEYYDYVRRY